MKFLILGGTQFVGRAIVHCLLNHGHEVTLVHRGKTNPGLFPGAHEIIADRFDLTQESWGGETYDAVIDVCGYVPRALRIATEALAGRAKHYVFISTISVYDVLQCGDTISEEDAVITLEDPTVEVINGETYGGLKALCEGELASRWSGTHAIVRPGLIVGPHDHTDRWTTWLMAIARGKRRDPSRPDQPSQMVDVRDLAAFVVRLASEVITGTYNVVGPAAPHTFGQIMDLAQETLNPDAGRETAEFDRPLDLGDEPTHDAIMRVSAAKALAAGLTLRPLAETMRDTVAWFKSEGRELKFK